MATLKKILSVAQRQMKDDGAHPHQFMTKEERANSWKKSPPKVMPSISKPQKEEGDDTKRFRAQVAQASQGAGKVRTKGLNGKRPKSAPKASRDGLTDIAAIAKELKIEPRIARAVLRDAKYPKPQVGWAFTDKQSNEVRKIIKGSMDAPTPKKGVSIAERRAINKAK